MAFELVVNGTMVLAPQDGVIILKNFLRNA